MPVPGLVSSVLSLRLWYGYAGCQSDHVATLERLSVAAERRHQIS